MDPPATALADLSLRSLRLHFCARRAIVCAMRELVDLLERSGYPVAVEDVLEAVADVLPPREEVADDLSERDRAYLDEFSGLVPASDQEVAKLVVRRAALATAEVARALDRTQAAERLGVSPSRISHRQAEGELYGFRVRPAKMLYPDWQFDDRVTIPGLQQIVEILPEGVPAVVIRRFMTEPDDALEVEDELVSPREWLLLGGDVERVAALAATLGDTA